MSILPLILASASPRRARLLSELGVPFTVVPSDVEEDETGAEGPREMVLHNARLKAEAVWKRFPDRVVLAADTTVFIENTILNKPGSLIEAAGMLRMLSGRTHTVFTGIALRSPQAPGSFEEGVESRVTFKKLSDEMIADYLRTVHTLDKAGGYAIQDGGERIIERSEGSFTNIVGLPMEETKRALQLFGILRE